jgi:hypothetical protein
MTTYSTTLYANNIPSGTGHGDFDTSTHLHAVSGSISTWAAGDTINVGYLPRNAVVVGAILKAASQLDTNGAPTLTLSLGVSGATTLFKNAITTVGRAAGVSADVTLAAAGALYKNTSGAKIAVLVTVGAAAATPVAGTLEVDIEYYVEDLAASNP